MTNAELIKGLRWCADESICCDDFSGEKCPYFDEKKDSCSVDEILHAAADALEAADKRIAELESNIPIVESVLVDKLNQRIMELEAQMPKEGEWIDDNGANVPLDRDGYTTGMCRCSVCGDWLIASDEYEVRGRYCPNCGAKMKGEQE